MGVFQCNVFDNAIFQGPCGVATTAAVGGAFTKRPDRLRRARRVVDDDYEFLEQRAKRQRELRAKRAQEQEAARLAELEARIFDYLMAQPDAVVPPVELPFAWPQFTRPGLGEEHGADIQAVQQVIEAMNALLKKRDEEDEEQVLIMLMNHER